MTYPFLWWTAAAYCMYKHQKKFTYHLLGGTLSMNGGQPVAPVLFSTAEMQGHTHLHLLSSYWAWNHIQISYFIASFTMDCTIIIKTFIYTCPFFSVCWQPLQWIAKIKLAKMVSSSVLCQRQFKYKIIVLPIYSTVVFQLTTIVGGSRAMQCIQPTPSFVLESQQKTYRHKQDADSKKHYKSVFNHVDKQNYTSISIL